MGDTIVNNRIAGTRITVWDITYYLEKGRSPQYIAEVLVPLEWNSNPATRFLVRAKCSMPGPLSATLPAACSSPSLQPIRWKPSFPTTRRAAKEMNT